MMKSFVHSARYCRKHDERVRRFLHQVCLRMPGSCGRCADNFHNAGSPRSNELIRLIACQRILDSLVEAGLPR
jgi:hypothetical protein